MPAYTSPDNIQYPVSTDAVAPLETVFANVANSTQDALDGFRGDWNTFENSHAIQTFQWADATERGAQTSMVAGDMGFQADTGVTYTYSGSAWLPSRSVVELASAAISAQSSFNIDGLTGFREYRITLDLPTSSVANTLTAQLRASGSADSTSNYDSQRNSGADSTNAAASVFGASSWANITISERSDKLVTLRVIGLNAAQRTIIEARVSMFNTSTNGLISDTTLRHRGTSGFTGIGFQVSSGTVSGTYTVEGIGPV